MSTTADLTTRPAQSPQEKLYTYAELVAELPESNRPCELWDGQLRMSPSPTFRHQKIALRLFVRLDEWVRSRKLGEVVASPIDMVLSEHRVTQPDVAFIAGARLHIIDQVINGPADLVAEVVSLGGRNRDRIEKRDLYEQHGVQEYWIIDPEPETVDVLHLVQSRYELVLRATPGQTASSKLLPGFEVNVEHLFRGES